MKLRELLEFNQIIVQCHDNPDADAIASGYALFRYLKDNGKDVISVGKISDIFVIFDNYSKPFAKSMGYFVI